MSLSSVPIYIRTSPRAKIIRAVVVFLQFVVVVLAIVGIFVGHLSSAKEKYEACHYVKSLDYRACYLCKDSSCIALQGYRRRCSNVGDNSMLKMGCNARQNFLLAAYGACISATVLSCVLLILVFLMMLPILKSPAVVASFSGLAAAGYYICWLLMLLIFLKKMCEGFYSGNGNSAENFKSFTNIGPGMILMIICSAFQTAITVLIFFT